MRKKYYFLLLVLLVAVIGYIINNESECKLLNNDLCSELNSDFIKKKIGEERINYVNERGDSLIIDRNNLLNLKETELYNLDNGIKTTGDPINDSLLVEAKKIIKKNNNYETLEYIYITESSKRIRVFENKINYLNNLFNINGKREKIKVLITDKNDNNQKALLEKLIELNCNYNDWGRLRKPGMNFGAVFGPNLCNGKSIIIYDLWQYQEGNQENPTSVIQTITDEYFTLMQINNGLLDEYNKNRWFYEGSQQIPFLYLAINENNYVVDNYIKNCDGFYIKDFTNIEFIPGKVLSCEHYLGFLASKLIIANVGFEKYLLFFNDNKTSFKDKFEKYFNIKYSNFLDKVNIYHQYFIKKQEKKIESYNDYKNITNNLRFN